MKCHFDANFDGTYYVEEGKVTYVISAPVMERMIRQGIRDRSDFTPFGRYNRAAHRFGGTFA